MNIEKQPPIEEGPPLEDSFPDYTEFIARVRVLSIAELVEQCQREIQAYHRGELPDESFGLELLRHALVQGNEDAWTAIQYNFGELVRGWLHSHPLRAAALRWESEESYIALAFERFWQATTRQQLVFKTLAGAFAYLRASLNGAILDTLRAYSRPREVSLSATDDLQVEDRADNRQVWEVIQNLLPDARERRLAFLIYQCGLKPREVVRFCPQEWNDIREVYRLRRNIVDRLLRNANQLRWRIYHP